MFLYSVIPEYIVGETTTTKLGALLSLYDSVFMLSYASHLLAPALYQNSTGETAVIVFSAPQT